MMESTPSKDSSHLCRICPMGMVLGVGVCTMGEMGVRKMVVKFARSQHTGSMSVLHTGELGIRLSALALQCRHHLRHLRRRARDPPIAKKFPIAASASFWEQPFLRGAARKVVPMTAKTQLTANSMSAAHHVVNFVKPVTTLKSRARSQTAFGTGLSSSSSFSCSSSEGEVGSALWRSRNWDPSLKKEMNRVSCPHPLKARMRITRPIYYAWMDHDHYITT